MIASFPHMGNMHITLQTLLKGLGAEVQVPPPVTKKTMDLGAQYSPETVCLPFKIMLGTFIEALEQGADTLVTCGGTGPCRLGYYAQIQKNILEEQGYKFDMLVIEPELSQVWRSLRRVGAGKGWRDIYSAFRLAGAKMAALDQVEEQTRYLRPRALQASHVEPIWRQLETSLSHALNIAAVSHATETALAQLASLPLVPERQPLRIAIAGEIYVMLEPFVNHNLDKRLGEMGVEVYKTMSLSEYVRVHLLKNREYVAGYHNIIEFAKPFLGHYVGGHGIKTIGCAAQAKQLQFDGMIQVLPFTCMPEVIAKNILPAVSETTNIPVLSLIFDEQSGEAGMLTRLEAYIDMLRYRRRR